MERLTVREIQEVELGILERFASFCDENKLRYCLCGGTLLGAIRHKGFIPWDDDIDVLMPRPDYERFLDIVETGNFEAPFEAVALRLGNETIPYAKVLDRRYELYKKYRHKGAHDYLWIDIFPMDGIKNDPREVEKTYRRVHALKKVYAISHAKPFTGKTKMRALQKTLLIPFAKMYGAVRATRNREKIAMKYSWDESEYVAGIVSGYGPCEVMPKKDWEAYVEVEFEGKYFHAPGNYDYYLKSLYKDYMKLPPEDKRKSHDMKVFKVGE